MRTFGTQGQRFIPFRANGDQRRRSSSSFVTYAHVRQDNKEAGPVRDTLQVEPSLRPALSIREAEACKVTKFT